MMPDQTREFTDERFENIVITNDGSTLFQVQELGPGGRFRPIDEFKAVEMPGRDVVSEPFARRRAQLYFDRMAKGGLMTAGGEEEGGVATATAVPPSRLKLGGPRSRPASPPQEKPQGVDPLAGMRQMTPADVDAVIAAARNERDPAKAAALRQQALSMMAQESKRRGENLSRAQCWVKLLLA